MRGEINILLLGAEPNYSDLFLKAASLYGNGLRLSFGGEIGGIINNLPNKMAPNTVLLMHCDFARTNALSQLRDIKGHSILRLFPLVIFGVNYTQKNCAECFAAGVAGIFPYSEEIEHLAKLLKVVGDYWRTSELSD